jgi:hypothetical protein
MLANLTARGIGRLFAEGGTLIHTHLTSGGVISPRPERPVVRARQWRLLFFSTRVRFLDPYRLGPGHQTWPRRCGSR